MGFLETKLLLAAGLILMASQSAMARGSEGGGGGAGMACTVNGVKHVELLDLWEGRNFLGLTPSSMDLDSDKKIIEIANLWDGSGPLVAKLFLNLKGNGPVAHPNGTSYKWEFLDPKIKILPPQDSMSHFFQEGCAPVGIAYMSDENGDLKVDKENFEAMSSIDKFALFVHEAIYRYMREAYGSSDSVIARKLTACAVASQPCPELSVRSGIPTTGPLYECRPDDWSKGNVEWIDYGKPTFNVFPVSGSAIDTWRFQLLGTNSGQWLLSKTYFDVPNLTGLHGEGFYQLGNLGSLRVATSTVFGEWLSTRQTISSDDPQKNMAIPMNYKIGIQDLTLTLNGSPLLCKEVRGMAKGQP